MKKLFKFEAIATTRAVFRASSLELAEKAWFKHLEDEPADWQENDNSGEEVTEEEAKDLVPEIMVTE